MPIFYDLSGMPVEVPTGRENDYLSWGYLTSPPHPDKGTSKVESEVTTYDQKEQSTSLAINKATLKEMSDRLGLSTAQARTIKDNRPYEAVEDLVKVMPDIAWLVIDSQIDYS